MAASPMIDMGRIPVSLVVFVVVSGLLLAPDHFSVAATEIAIEPGAARLKNASGGAGQCQSIAPGGRKRAYQLQGRG